MTLVQKVCTRVKRCSMSIINEVITHTAVKTVSSGPVNNQSSIPKTKPIQSKEAIDKEITTKKPLHSSPAAKRTLDVKA